MFTVYLYVTCNYPTTCAPHTVKPRKNNHITKHVIRVNMLTFLLYLSKSTLQLPLASTIRREVMISFWYGVSSLDSITPLLSLQLMICVIHYSYPLLYCLGLLLFRQLTSLPPFATWVRSQLPEQPSKLLTFPRSYWRRRFIQYIDSVANDLIILPYIMT